MKQVSFSKGMIGIRIFLTTLVLTIASLFLFSFTVSSKLTTDIWKQLGISQQQGADKIKSSFLNNYFDYYGIRNAKNIATGNRVGIAKDLLTFTKQYVSGVSFKNEYEKLRTGAKPEPPAANAKTKEEVRKEYIRETQESIKKLEDNMKNLDASMKKIMQEGIDMNKKTLKDYQDPNSKTIEIFINQK
ncbi:MAG: hypothetical protein WDN26_17185 [Chitinophagaceae bacterium]